MRDPNRIPKYCNELQKIWKKVPDWRFGQLMMNFLSDIEPALAFYMEDEEFLKLLNDYIENWSKIDG